MNEKIGVKILRLKMGVKILHGWKIGVKSKFYNAWKGGGVNILILHRLKKGGQKSRAHYPKHSE